MTAPTVISKDEYALVGETSADSIIVRGGRHPLAIKVSHPKSTDLLTLIEFANAGIKAEKKS